MTDDLEELLLDIINSSKRKANAEQAKKWREKNPDKWKKIVRKSQAKYFSKNKEKCNERIKNWRKVNKYYFRDRDLKRQYNLTIDDVIKMKKKQNNKCKICNLEKELVVDHCHKTYKIRGLLCRNCNYGLGHFKDDINILLKAMEYLG